jgi:hypothetical protein
MDQNLREISRVKRAEAAAVPAPAVQAARRIDLPMIYWLDEPRDQNEFVTVRTLWVTVALSFIVHLVALLLVLEQTHLLGPPEENNGEATEQLQVRLTAPPSPVPPPVPEQPREVVALPKPARASRPPAPKAPPVIALTAPTKGIPTPVPAPPTPTPQRPTPPAEGDLWSYMQARRRERGESETPVIEAPKAQPNANIAANLPTGATGAATPDLSRGGGIFQIKREDYDDAAFLFFGWNKDMERKTPQLIEVRIGNNSNMRIAIVRKMIEIIREHEKGDFEWQRRDRVITLSARPQDNAVLEDFLLHDLWSDRR